MRRPDRPKSLEETWNNVIARFQPYDEKLAVGGRSMGGQISSQVVAQSIFAHALALFAYPLKPPYNRALPRYGHLPDIAGPTLCYSGTRDSFASSSDLVTAAAKITYSTAHEYHGANHGFGALKSSSLSRYDVWKEAVDVMLG